MKEKMDFRISYVQVASDFDDGRDAANFLQHGHMVDLEQNNISSRRKNDQEEATDEVHSLHIAAKSGDIQRVAQILSEKPECARRFNHEGYTALHLASYFDHLDVVRELVRMNSRLCLLKDKDGRTPLHTAAMKGGQHIMKELLSACPESVMEVTATDETPFHIAMSHGQVTAVEFLLDWIKRRPNLSDVINKRDSAGNTLLHLAVSRKHLQTIKFLVEESRISVNARNDSGFTALDIYDVLPPENKDTEIEKIFGRAGALTANQLAERMSDCTNNESSMKSQGIWYYLFDLQPASLSKTKDAGHYACLVAATLIAATSFLATFFSPRLKLDNTPTQIDMQSSYLSHLFVLFDSIAFVTSTTLMIIILVRELPLKPWLLVSVFSMFGAFTCSVKAVSPGDALPVLFLGSFTLFAAVSKYLAELFRYLLIDLQSLCLRTRKKLKGIAFAAHSCLRTY